MQLSAKAGASGRLFGAVTPADIAAAVAAAGGPTFDRRKIELAQPVKSLGKPRSSRCTSRPSSRPR